MEKNMKENMREIDWAALEKNTVELKKLNVKLEKEAKKETKFIVGMIRVAAAMEKAIAEKDFKAVQIAHKAFKGCIKKYF